MSFLFTGRDSFPISYLVIRIINAFGARLKPVVGLPSSELERTMIAMN